ncbi:hypothetical protein CUJ83_11960 [Methanocella sp. CWC-04]|uniref:Uncharacterized protein n=1 Tax=Methanooceanicella nereidis TaxID=2052831 RepID=A0AAP2RE67_9EURY|nr:hypothetical protein [Methanocella sp. CWC-04]MCD1295713.1 hypothetical protein [Methanocella sp. CWC-04]
MVGGTNNTVSDKDVFSGYYADNDTILENKNEKIETSINRTYYLLSLSSYSFCLYGDILDYSFNDLKSPYILAKNIENNEIKKNVYIINTFDSITSNKDAIDSKDPGENHDLKLFDGLDFVIMNRGNGNDALLSVKNKIFSFAHVSLNEYEYNTSALEFIYERMVCGGIILIDDTGENIKGNTINNVAEDFMWDKEEPYISLSTGQCFIIKS